MRTFRDPRELLAEVRAERTIQRREKLTDDDIDQPLERGGGGDPFTEDAQNSHFAEPAWPVMHEAAYCGLAGEVVRSIEPHSEADPVAFSCSF